MTGKTDKTIPSLLKFEDDGTIYVPVKKIAGSLGYEMYNGEYGEKSEDISKCYVESKDEVANMTLSSNKMYKLDLESNTQNYDYYYLKKPVKAIDGELYISSDDMTKVFNTQFEYDSTKMKVTMLTLPYLVNGYSTKILDYNYKEIDDTFINKEAILSGYIVVKKSDNKDSYGVINATTGDAVIDAKYSKIKYLPNIGDYIVESDGKYGIASSDKKTKVESIYDDIQLIDSDAGLYAVKKDNKYGVIDLKGKFIINIEYDKIGIDKTKFKENNIKNSYLLVDNLIPAKKDDYWGMLDKKGNKVVDFVFDSFGYIATNNKNAKNLLVIPDYNEIVVCKDKKYALINSSGKLLFAPVVDDIYMTVEDGQTKYYMMYNDQKMDVEQYLNKTGIKKTDQ